MNRKWAIGVLCCLGAVFLTCSSALAAAIAEKPAPTTVQSAAFRPGVPGSGRGQAGEFRESAAPGRYIVVLEDSVAKPAEVARAQTSADEGNLGFVYRSAMKGYSVAGLSGSDVEALRSNPKVDYVVPDRKIQLMSQVTPTGVSRISALTNPALAINEVDDVRVNADVAVIDSGIDYTDTDLNVVARTNCVPANEENASTCVDGTGTDGDGHGTHVAGTIGAIDNSSGVVGVAPGVRLWAVRVLNNEGAGYTSWVLAGINWVTAHASEIEVANMSLGGMGSSLPEQEAIGASVNAGVVYSVAGGNYALNTRTESPANDPSVITVSALADWDGAAGGKGSSNPKCTNWGADDTLASFSDFGNQIEIAAPGVCIYSTLPGNTYGYDSGTSMAAPHVSGAAAMLASKANPNSRFDVEAIRNTLVNEGSLNWEDTSEDGKVEPLLYVGGEPLTQTEVATAGASPASTSAILGGSLNSRGRAVSYEFEYGTTATYGQVTPSSPGELPTGTRYQTVSATATGLESETTYHFRLVATDTTGTFKGKDHTFTTSRWRGQLVTPPASEEDWLNDVSCSAPGVCMAVGHYYAQGNLPSSFWMTGGAWQSAPMPSVSGASTPTALGVSCVGSTCVAVGRMYSSGAGMTVPLSMVWNGTTWTYLPVTPPAGALYSQLNRVSCSSPSSCIAVGYYKNAGGVWVNYSTQLAQGQWSILSTPNAADSTESELDDVSCLPSGVCTAAGWYVGSSSGVANVVLTFNGSAWTLRTKSAAGVDHAVSCVSAEFCEAVGGQLSAEKWNGVEWASQSVPHPAGYNGGSLGDVSCTSAKACTAVGYYYRGERFFSLVAVWNGSAWSVQPPPRSDEASEELLGVSCVTFGGCKAVGGSEEDVYRSLIESRDDIAVMAPSAVSPTSATLRGTLNPEGVETTYHFEYGPTTGYGTSVPVSDASAGAGSQALALTQPITGLHSETTYHYRLVATTSQGHAYSEDATFMTPASPSTYSLSIGTTGSGEGNLSGPQGVTLDSSGNLLVADKGNNRIEKFSPTGTYLGQFGAGVLNAPSDIAIAPSGYIWVTDTGHERLVKFTSNGGYVTSVGAEGTGAGQFVEPTGIAIAPSGNIWVADSRYYRLEEFGPNGEFVREVHGAGHGGEGNAEFGHPVGITTDAQGDVWATDTYYSRIQELGPSGEFIRKFGTAGSGSGQLQGPEAIEVKPSGNLLITDTRNSRVEEFSPTGEFLMQFGAPGSGPGKFAEPDGIAASGGLIYVSDWGNNRAQEWQQPMAPEATTQPATGVKSTEATLSGSVNPNGLTTKYHFEIGPTTSYGTLVPATDLSAGSGTTVVAVSKAATSLSPATAYHYRLVASNADGNTYGADSTFKTESTGPAYALSIGSTGSGEGNLSGPQGVTLDSSGNLLVADKGNNRIEKFSPTGTYLGQFGAGVLNAPSDIAIAPSGYIWVTDTGHERLVKFTSNGGYVTSVGAEGTGAGQFVEPTGIAIAPSGNIWVADSRYYRLEEFGPNGEFVREVHGAGHGGEGNAEFGHPVGITTDAQGDVWATDTYYSRIQELGPSGEFIRKFGTAGSGSGQLQGPEAIEVKPSGNLLITDTRNSRVEEFSPTGEFLMQFGAPGSGPGKFAEPDGIAFAPGGLIYVSDWGNNRVQKWTNGGS
jgi:DNA-binding beta-propeller fold protein YncE/subtilisin family serine protease